MHIRLNIRIRVDAKAFILKDYYFKIEKWLKMPPQVRYSNIQVVPTTVRREIMPEAALKFFQSTTVSASESRLTVKASPRASFFCSPKPITTINEAIATIAPRYA